MARAARTAGGALSYTFLLLLVTFTAGEEEAATGGGVSSLLSHAGGQPGTCTWHLLVSLLGAHCQLRSPARLLEVLQFAEWWLGPSAVPEPPGLP